MTVGTKWVGQVRAILAEAKPRETPETQARRAFERHEFNSAAPVYAEQTPRARAMREIGRVAAWYGLQGEVARALDQAGVSLVEGLEEAALEQLLARMRLLEDCIQNGGDAPDAPAAR